MSGLFCTILTNLSKDASAEPSLIEELWKYLSEKYFTLDMGQYENLGFSGSNGGLINLSWAIVALCLGMVIAAVMAVYEKRGLGEFVRKIHCVGVWIFKAECFFPQC